MKSCTVDCGCTPAPKDNTKLAVFFWCSFAFFESFFLHFNKKQRAEVIFRLSRPVSCKNQENGSGKQWSLHAPLNWIGHWTTRCSSPKKKLRKSTSLIEVEEHHFLCKNCTFLKMIICNLWQNAVWSWERAVPPEKDEWANWFTIQPIPRSLLFIFVAQFSSPLHSVLAFHDSSCQFVSAS